MPDSSPAVALVTGASSGIGLAIAERLLQEGLLVVAAARRVDRMEDLRRRGALVTALDITSEESLQALLRTVRERHRRLDVLVNNAGYGCYGSVEETPIEDARHQFEVNLFGLARLTQLVLPWMRQQGSGRIINVSSMAGRIYTPLGAWYHASKHALEGWSDCLRLEVAPFGIAVVIVQPGLIRSEFAELMMAPLLERSGSGPYATITEGIVRSFRRSFGSSASPAEVVAEQVARAVRSPRPQTRYAMGAMARPLLFLRHWLGDRLYDWGVMRVMR